MTATVAESMSRDVPKPVQSLQIRACGTKPGSRHRSRPVASRRPGGGCSECARGLWSRRRQRSGMALWGWTLSRVRQPQHLPRARAAGPTRRPPWAAPPLPTRRSLPPEAPSPQASRGSSLNPRASGAVARAERRWGRGLVQGAPGLAAGEGGGAGRGENNLRAARVQSRSGA